MQFELSLHLFVYSLPIFVLFCFVFSFFPFLDSPCFMLASEQIQ